MSASLSCRGSKNSVEEKGMDWYCYCLKSSGGGTYIGATVDPDRRLRQHRGELSGGARATRARVGAGETWTRHCYVGPFSKHDALSFEWHWKYESKKHKGSALDRRCAALGTLLEKHEDKELSVIFD